MTDDHPKIIPLFNIDIVEAVSPYLCEPAGEDQDASREPDPKSVQELWHACEALEYLNE